MFLHKTPSIFFWLYPQLVWRKDTSQKEVFLTFDDGPIPSLTPWVLDLLKTFDAKATFFCVGHNVEKHPGIFERVLKEGHSVGNHTFNHLNGWQTGNLDYLRNTLRADEVIGQYLKTNLFRPPYGRIRRKQRQQLRHKQIVMWDVLSGDFSQKLKPVEVLKNTMKHTRPGSIVVFHDNPKAELNLRFALPAYLKHFVQRGYSFKAL